MAEYVIDIETNLKHDRIWLAVLLNVETKEITCLREVGSLKSLVEAGHTFIGHNIVGFDSIVLNKVWDTNLTLSQLQDTLLMSQLANPDQKEHSLEALGAKLGFPKDDYRAKWEEARGRPEAYDGERFDDPEMELLEAYCVTDVKVTAKLLERLRVEMDYCPQDAIDLERDVKAIITEQERFGIGFNYPKASKLFCEVEARFNELVEELPKVFPPKVVEVQLKTKVRVDVIPFNPLSRIQIAERLQEMGWKPTKRTEKGNVSIDDDVLESITMPEAAPFQEVFMLNKRISQIKQWTNAVGTDGRIHGRVWTMGTVTSRMSHSNPNMAQVPANDKPYGVRCRELFGPEPESGLVLVGIDAAQLELRMLAHYMRDDEYIQLVTAGDVHTANMVAAGLLSRDQAKTFIYAFLYGAGAEKIGSIVGGGYKEGKRLIEAFLENTPALKDLRKTVMKLAEKGWIEGLDGRRHPIRSAHSSLNALLQGAGAIVMKRALVIFNRNILEGGYDAHFCANVHDEWQLESRVEYAHTLGRLGVRAIREAGEYYQMRCPLDGNYKVGYNWAETH